MSKVAVVQDDGGSAVVHQSQWHEDARIHHLNQLAPPGVGARAGVKSVRTTLDRHRQQVGLLCIGKRIRSLVPHDQSLAGQDVEGVAEEIEYGVVVGDEVVRQDLRPVVGVSHARLAA